MDFEAFLSIDLTDSNNQFVKNEIDPFLYIKFKVHYINSFYTYDLSLFNIFFDMKNSKCYQMRIYRHLLTVF